MHYDGDVFDLTVSLTHEYDCSYRCIQFTIEADTFLKLFLRRLDKELSPLGFNSILMQMRE